MEAHKMTMPTLNIENVNNAYKLGIDGNYEFNCWGTTLYCLNVEKDLKWIDRKTMSEFLDCNTKQINLNKIIEGDIIVLLDNDVLVHTGIYIGNNKYFHKRGALKVKLRAAVK